MQTDPLTTDERAELQLLRDLRARVIGFGGDDYTIMSWEAAHRIHESKGEPYIGCCFCRGEFVRKPAEPAKPAELLADDAAMWRATQAFIDSSLDPVNDEEAQYLRNRIEEAVAAAFGIYYGTPPVD